MQQYYSKPLSTIILLEYYSTIHKRNPYDCIYLIHMNKDLLLTSNQKIQMVVMNLNNIYDFFFLTGILWVFIL